MQAIVTFNLDADLRSAFQWNTKQLFVYLQVCALRCSRTQEVQACPHRCRGRWAACGRRQSTGHRRTSSTTSCCGTPSSSSRSVTRRRQQLCSRDAPSQPSLSLAPHTRRDALRACPHARVPPPLPPPPQDQAHIRLRKHKTKYAFIDHGRGLRGAQLNLTLHWSMMPYVGARNRRCCCCSPGARRSRGSCQCQRRRHDVAASAACRGLSCGRRGFSETVAVLRRGGLPR